MKKRLLLITALIGAALAFSIITHVEAQTSRSPQFRLVWEEDFSGTELDTTYWQKIERIGYTEWAKYMSSDNSLYDLRNGRMRLYARANHHGQINPHDTAKFLTGGISTMDKFTFTFGRVEVRARIHGARGCWPAIWIKANDRKRWGYPERSEIDLIEYYNHDDIVHQTIHTNYTDILKKTKEYPNEVKPKINKNRWNTYAVDILPDSIIFYVNGKQTLIYPRIQTDEVGQFPFGVPSYLMLDMQVGNPWLTPVASDFPAWMDIDWVRVYEYVK